MLPVDDNASALIHNKAPRSNSLQRQLHNFLLEFLDAILSSLIVGPCVIAFWRGTWELMSVIIFPDNMPLSAWTSLLIGGAGHLVFTLTQSFFIKHIHPDKRRLSYYVISRVYTAIFGIVCVNLWRGTWVLCDWLTSAKSLVIIYIVTLVALVFLITTRTVRNLVAAPYTVAMDHKTDYFEVGTMFRIQVNHQPGLYLLDTLFSVFVIGNLVVVAWRGLWGIMDFTLYPDDYYTSSWSSLIIGYVSVLITFILQPIISFACRKMGENVFKLLLCDLFYFLMFFGSVNAWRGIWNLLGLYVYPDNPVLSFWLTCVIPFLILAAIKCANSVLVRGVFIDAESDDTGDCVAIPINYVRLHFEREREKKTKIRIQQCNHKHQQHFAKHFITREACSTLIDASTGRVETKIQNGMDAKVSLV